MRHLEQGTGMAYRLRGSPDGAPVIFVHGAGGNKLAWLSLTRHLAALMPGRALVTVDLPGHGESEGEGRERVDAYASDLIAFMDGLGFARADLVAHSMGSAVCLTLALDAPDRVRRLAVISGGYRLPTSPQLIEALEQDYEAAVRHVGEVGFGENADPREVSAIVDGLLACKPATTIADFKACAAFDVKARMEELNAPLAVFFGTRDVLTSPERNKALALAAPNATILAFENAGHMLMVERAKELAGAVAEFLAS
ncbi:MAG: alpha/beta fold hydrolase [Deltaproteobacteria bacterium]|nr:alpha/beta fold hydrolase [Deltaproteobacteria bacterium]